MEYRPNSTLERTVDIGPDFINLLFTEKCVTNRIINLWSGPRYITYNTKASRLQSFINWPQGINLSTESLNDAGFFYIGAIHIQFQRIGHFV